MHERTLAWDDPTVAIEWPLPSGLMPNLSPKDKQGKAFSDIEKFT
jgi:dTDP-4-dehydrorhamnose 3,5-epimerase